MKKMKKFLNWVKKLKSIALVVLILIAGYFLQGLMDISRHINVLSYSAFLDRVDQSDIKELHVEGQEIRGVLRNNTWFQTVAPEHDIDFNLFRQRGIDINIVNQTEYGYYWYLLLFIICGFACAAIWYMIRQARGGGGMGGGSNLFTMGKCKARMFMPSSVKETFNSVAGAIEAKEELYDVVDYLRNPKKYRRLGAKMTRGVLLIGEPGNGKTLLARAVAGEANCPFFSVSGSEFIEVFVGVGSARVRDLFAQARRHAPSIIFIDEIDAIGKHRGTGLGGGGHDEREQTLNQLLTEMDGFQTSDSSVIVIAATNRPDVLDKALLRPGRFDRTVQVPYPDQASREQILRVHAQTIKMDPTVDLNVLARGTPGFSGADLANLINEAAIDASKDESDLVSIVHFERARDKIILGKESKSIKLTPEDKKVIAYHEAGHALTRLLMPDVTDVLHKVTIIPRGKALGVTHFMPEREKYSTSKEEMEASVITALGGRVAEEIIFNRLTTGAYSDFKAATDIVRKMVCSYGMVPAELSTLLYMQHGDDFQHSESTATKIDNAIRQIMDECYQKTRTLLSENKDKLDKLAHALLEKETMYAGEIYELLGITPRTEHRFL